MRDTDRDTWSDGDEQTLGSDPTDAQDVPMPPLVTAREIGLGIAPRGPVRVRGKVMRNEPYAYLQEAGDSWAGMRVDGLSTDVGFTVGESVELLLTLGPRGLVHVPTVESWHSMTPLATPIVVTEPTLGLEDIDLPGEARAYAYMTVRVAGTLEVMSRRDLRAATSARPLIVTGYDLEDDFAVGDSLDAVTGVLFFYYTATAVPGPGLDVEGVGDVEFSP